MIGVILDTVYTDGNPLNAQHGLQTVNVPPAGGAIVDMNFTDPGGLNPIVNHAFAYAQAWAVSVFQVANSSIVSSTSTVLTTASGHYGGQVSILQGSAVNSPKTYYSPSTATVVIGVNNMVTCTNNDNAWHALQAINGKFDSGNLNPGQSWGYSFTTPGTNTYTCTYHPWMTGTVVVLSG